YSMSLPVDEFRGIERVLDRICGVVLPPRATLEHVHLSGATVGGVPGIWFRPRDARPRLRMLYLHGGGYIGTSPRMYTLFAAHLARATRCDVFVADYRLAPAFPYPAGLDDALAVLAAIHADEPDATMLIAGDSGGGGLAASVLYECGQRGLPDPAGALLFSPEISLSLDLPSVTENAPYDVL